MTVSANQAAHKIVWQAVVPITAVNGAPAQAQNTPVKVMQIFTINKEKGYVITYKATPSDYDTYLPQAQQVMNSFAFT